VHVFVAALVADPARADAVERVIRAAHQRTTPFADQPHEATVWRAGHVVVGSFAIHTDALTTGPPHRASAESFDAYAGLPRLGGLAGDAAWAPALAEARRAGRLRPEELGGVWTLLHADADHLEVRSSLTGSEPVAIARRPGLVVVANRASLARATAWPDQPLLVDTDALIPLCARGWLGHDRLPFTGLQALPPGSALEVRPDGSRLRRTHHLDADIGAKVDGGTRSGPRGDHGAASAADGGQAQVLSDELADRYDRIAGELVDAAGEVARLGPVPHLEAAGDVTSRLAAAVYHAAGVEVVVTTPDDLAPGHVQTAARIAGVLDAPHQVEPAGISHRDLPDQLTRQVRFGEGLSNVHDPCPPLRPTPRLKVVRQAAGALLGGYDNLAVGPRPPIVSVVDGQAFLDDLTLHNAALVLREDARIAQQQVNRRLAEELLDEVGRLSFHELAYLRLREGRANGANRQAAAYGAIQVAPMLDDRVLVHLAGLPLEHKRSQRAVVELLRRLSPELAALPLVATRWRFEADGAVPWFDPEGWASRSPVAAGTNTARPWRVTESGRLPAVLSRRLAAPEAGLEEIVDRARLRAALQGGGPLGASDLRSLYGVATAQHLTSGRWSEVGRRRGRDRAAG